MEHMNNPNEWMNKRHRSYQLSANVVQVPYIDQELLQIHCKVSRQERNRRRLDHVLMLKEKSAW
jgi:hypothetical protein